MKSLRWRVALTLVVTILAIIYALPSVPGVSTSPLMKVLPEDKINLGLDLQGGIHLTLGVGVDTALENSLAQSGQSLRSMAREDEVVVLRPQVKDQQLVFVLLKAEQQEKLDAMIAESFKEFSVSNKETLDGGKIRYTMGISDEYKKYIQDMALDQAIKTIRSRIDEFGVTEPDIRKQQDYRIQVQLPGIKDPERAIDLLGKTAHLEFKLVNEEADLENAKKGILPADSELKMLLDRRADGTYAETPIVLKRDVVLTGEYITNANTNFDTFGQPYVMLTFDSTGARLFERLTEENVKKRMAIVLDGKVYSAPVIQERIAGGRCSISGRFTVDEARDLAIVLRAGSLPAPIKIMEERTVGPSLGQESIDKGVKAALIGGCLVIIFMIIYYGFAGCVADMVLALNILLIMAGLAAFGATLTLPGIAGIILTIGMAVDANVLIYERIREEIRKGLTPLAAVTEGYGRATLTILDANVTTVIAAIILYQFGTGPIRGFAVTLTLGILASMFTAIFVSRILFDMWLKRKPGATLNI